MAHIPIHDLCPLYLFMSYTNLLYVLYLMCTVPAHVFSSLTIYLPSCPPFSPDLLGASGDMPYPVLTAASATDLSAPRIVVTALERTTGTLVAVTGALDWTVRH